MARIVLGRLAEKIYHEVDAPSIEDNFELADVLREVFGRRRPTKAGKVFGLPKEWTTTS